MPKAKKPTTSTVIGGVDGGIAYNSSRTSGVVGVGVGGGGGGYGRQQLTVASLSGGLRFPDDFAEYVARADSGGSTYGLLKRHAFAHSSLRTRPTTASAAGAADDGDGGADLRAPAQRPRSKSLNPPRTATAAASSSYGRSPQDLAEQKNIIKVLCEQAAAASAGTTVGAGAHGQRTSCCGNSLQVGPMTAMELRRHSSAAVCGGGTVQIGGGGGGGTERRPSYLLQPISYTGGGGGGASLQPGYCVGGDPTCYSVAVPQVCRRRSFSVTPKGLVNEGDDLLLLMGGTATGGASGASAMPPTGDDATAAGFLMLQAVGASSRRSSYNSCDGGGSGGNGGPGSGESSVDTAVHRVLMLGGPGVGKTALTQQFLTSEFMAAENTSFGKSSS